MKSIEPNHQKEDKEMMEKLLRSGGLAHKYAKRLQVVLRRAAGESVAEVARQTGLTRAAISPIIHRYNYG